MNTPAHSKIRFRSIATLLVAPMMIASFMLSGCDLGTYESRANAPVPDSVLKSGDVQDTAPAEESDDDN